MSETMFRGGSPTRLNACVGDNGCVNYFEYAEGFSLAANALLDKVIEGKSIETSPDYLVYPICFNMRHSIELRLKGAIGELAKIAKSVNKTLEHDRYSTNTQEEKLNIIYVHNIKAIWDFFKKNAIELDCRFKYLICMLEHHVLDIANIDPTGQTFRYPISKESKKHLVDIGGLISCKVLKDEFGELHKNLDKLFIFTKELLEEYQLSSVKDGVSRLTLYLIALHFQNVNSSKDYKERKVTAKKKFGLSNKELDFSIERIVSHFEFSQIVQEKNNLLGITERQVFQVIEHWLYCNPQIFEKSKSGLIHITAGDFSIEEMQKDRDKLATVLEMIKSELSIEYSAGLHALFYFSRDGIDYSESYRDLYHHELKYCNSKDTFMHVFTKPNLLEMILVSLFYLGFEKLASDIIDKFDLQNSNLNISAIRTPDCYVRKTLLQEYTQNYIKEIS